MNEINEIHAFTKFTIGKENKQVNTKYQQDGLTVKTQLGCYGNTEQPVQGKDSVAKRQQYISNMFLL